MLRSVMSSLGAGNVWQHHACLRSKMCFVVLTGESSGRLSVVMAQQSAEKSPAADET